MVMSGFGDAWQSCLGSARMVLSSRGNAGQSWNGLKGASGQVVVTHGRRGPVFSGTSWQGG